MNEIVLGLDIGGANLKAALSSGSARSRSFALWKRPVELGSELQQLIDGWRWDRIAITMTGELCDCFATKREGACHIIQSVMEAIGPHDVWTIKDRFVTSEQALKEPLHCAASNWLALATFCSRFASAGPALLLDIGSTTTDVVPLLDGKPVPQGCTDSVRLKCGELIYTGVRRTPLCALLGWQGMAEFFATTQDVYLMLDNTTADSKVVDTADGRPATQECAHARLARMLGGDSESMSIDETRALAMKVKELQLERIAEAVSRALPHSIVILSGSGEFLGREVMVRLNHDRFVSLGQELGSSISSCACAFSVAKLSAEGRHGP